MNGAILFDIYSSTEQHFLHGEKYGGWLFCNNYMVVLFKRLNHIRVMIAQIP
jgi:hypothetical protein